MNLQFTHYLTLPVGFFGEPDVNLRELNSSEISCLLNLSEFLKKCALIYFRSEDHQATQNMTFPDQR